MKLAKADKERRYKQINKLIKKYYTKERTMPQVHAMVRNELNISQTTVRLAVLSNL